MAEKDSEHVSELVPIWDLMGTDVGGLPIHLPMAVNRNGDGPADSSDAVKVVCWCQNPKCPVTRALEEARELGRREALDEEVCPDSGPVVHK